MSHLKKKRKKFESIRDVFQNCGKYYTVDIIIKCLKWIHGVDKVISCVSNNHSLDFYWKGKMLVKFETNNYDPTKHEYIISTLEQYYILHKFEQLMD